MYQKEYEFKDKEYLAWLHDGFSSCICCGSNNIEAHHIKKLPLLQKRNDLMVVPLCTEHHRGKYSPHGADSDRWYEDYPVAYQMQLAILNYTEYAKERVC